MKVTAIYAINGVDIKKSINGSRLSVFPGIITKFNISPFVINNQMELKTKEIPHGGLSSLSNAIKDFVSGNALIFASPYRSGIYK